MHDIPERISLVAQTEKILRHAISRGRWKGRLPGERRLCQELQVSRGTMRGALQELAKQKIIRIRPGRCCDIILRPGQRAARRPLSRVACLSPEPLWRLPPFVVIWIDELREGLQRMNLQLEVYHRPQCYGANATRKLEEMVEQNPHAGWILIWSTRMMQLWFQERQERAVVVGSLYDGVQLPSVDTNFRALGRHAGGMMFARGHRRMALLGATLGPSGVAPGISEMERGLRETFATNRHSDKELTVIYHDGSPTGICASLDRLLNLARPPSVILIAHSTTLLATLTYLAQRGVVVPRDLSIVVSHDEPFYSHIIPELTHYEWNPRYFASQIRRQILYALDRRRSTDGCIRLMPKFISGATLTAQNVTTKDR